jgi:hypothetical protein
MILVTKNDVTKEELGKLREKLEGYGLELQINYGAHKNVIGLMGDVSVIDGEQLTAVEAQLGHSIDKGYRDFLMCANGWKCFSQTVNLFGTGDLMGSSLMDYALEILCILDDENVIASSGFTKAELLPIAATFEDRDLFVMTRATSHQPGVVIWSSGQEIERYLNFEKYFLTMADYNRLEIDRLKKDS